MEPQWNRFDGLGVLYCTYYSRNLPFNHYVLRVSFCQQRPLYTLPRQVAQTRFSKHRILHGWNLVETCSSRQQYYHCIGLIDRLLETRLY